MRIWLIGLVEGWDRQINLPNILGNMINILCSKAGEGSHWKGYSTGHGERYASAGPMILLVADFLVFTLKLQLLLNISKCCRNHEASSHLCKIGLSNMAWVQPLGSVCKECNYIGLDARIKVKDWELSRWEVGWAWMAWHGLFRAKGLCGRANVVSRQIDPKLFNWELPLERNLYEFLPSGGIRPSENLGGLEILGRWIWGWLVLPLPIGFHIWTWSFQIASSRYHSWWTCLMCEAAWRWN